MPSISVPKPSSKPSYTNKPGEQYMNKPGDSYISKPGEVSSDELDIVQRKKTISGGADSSQPSNQQTAQVQDVKKEQELKPVDERQLRSLNLQARQQYQKQVASGTDRKQALDKLRSELSRNRLAFQIQRIESGRIGGYKTPQIEIKRNESGQIQVVERKTGNVFDKNLAYVKNQYTEYPDKIKVQSQVSEITQPEKRPPIYTRKDIDYKATLQGSLPAQNKTTAQTYINQQATIFFNKVAQKVGQVIPEGKAKEVLLREDKDFDYTALAKFSLFAPAQATTTEGTQQLIKQGVFIPESKTSFLASTRNLGNDFTEVNVISQTRTGKQNVLGLSKQIAKEGDISVSVGKQYQVMRTPKGVEVNKFDVLGLSKDLGKAQRVREGTGFKVASEIGEGSKASVLSRMTGGFTKQNRLDLITGKSLTTYKNIPARPEVSRSDLTGAFRQSASDESITGFIGQTDKGILRIYKSGRVTKVIDNPNVKGFIFRDKTPSIESDSFGNVYIQKQTLSPTARQKIQEAVSSLAKQAEQKAIEKSLVSPLLKSSGATGFASASALESPRTSTEVLQGDINMLRSQSAYAGTGQYERTDETISPILSQPHKSEEKTFNVISNILKSDQETTQRQRNIPTTILNQPIRQEENQRSRVRQFFDTLLVQRQQQRLKQKTGFSFDVLPKPNVKPPKITSDVFSSVKNKISFTPKQAFDVIVKRRGKEITLISGLPEGKATRLGVKNALSTLARSYRLQPKGFTTEEDITFREPSNVFRPSKRGGFRVQKSRYSLSSPTEKSEIQFFRKKKAKRFKWF